MAKRDLRKGIAKEALSQAKAAVETGDWAKAKESILVALVTAEAALSAGA